MVLLAGDGAGRGGYRWGLIGGDPTPGDCAAVQAMATAMMDANGRALDAVGTIAMADGGVATADWAGPLSRGFLPALEPIRSDADDLKTATSTAAEALHTWLSALEANQAAAVSVVLAAEDAEHRRVTAELEIVQSALPALHAAQHAAAIASSSDDEADAAWAASQVAAAQAHLNGLRHQIRIAEEDLDETRRQAIVLAEQHQTEGDGCEQMLLDAILDMSLRPDFGSSVALPMLRSTNPTIVFDADGDGRLEASELAAILEHLGSERSSAWERAKMLEALTPLLATTVTDPDTNRELIEALGPEGVIALAERMAEDALAASRPHPYLYGDQPIAFVVPPEGSISALEAMGIQVTYTPGEPWLMSPEELADVARVVGTFVGAAALLFLLAGIALATTAAAAAAATSAAAGAGSGVAAAGTISFKLSAGAAAVAGTAGVIEAGAGLAADEPEHVMNGTIGAVTAVTGGALGHAAGSSADRIVLAVREGVIYIGGMAASAAVEEE